MGRASFRLVDPPVEIEPQLIKKLTEMSVIDLIPRAFKMLRFAFTQRFSHVTDTKTRSAFALEELEETLIIDNNSNATDDVIAPAVDSTYSSEIIGAAMSKVATLDALINLLTFDLKFDEFINKILSTLIRETKCEAGSILEVDYKNQNIFFRSVHGNCSEALKGCVIPLGKGIVGHVIESRQPIVVHNIPENRDHLSSIAKAIGFEARNLIAIPILIRGKVFGVIELLNRVGEPNFTNIDIELLSYLTQMVAKTIEIRLMIVWTNKTTPEGNKKEAA